MKWIQLAIAALVMGMGGCGVSSAPLSSPGSRLQPLQPKMRYQTHRLPQAIAHSLLIPPQRFQVTPALAPGVDTLETFVQRQGAIAAINAGFFDPVNQESTSFITLKGKLVADPRRNQRLIHNPDLAPYLSQILNRSEFRRYRCGQGWKYAIARHNDPVPTYCQLVDAMGGGPRLLPENTAIQEGFIASANGTIVRDALGASQLNARSAIGITPNGDILLVMVAQKPQPSPSGITLTNLAAFMKTLGAEQAMNLDGGTSATLYVHNQTTYGKLNNSGEPIGRPVKSVLLIQTREP